MLELNPMKKVLLIYPRYPDTFWSFKHILRFISKKAAFPPLGLLTVAAQLPKNWKKKLIDMNVTTLEDKDLEWADYVFISAMIVQKEEVGKIIERCQRLKVKIVAGGPLFTTGYREFKEIDHFVLNEAETTLPSFLKDLKNGCPKHLYTSCKRPDIRKTPLPLWNLIKMKDYASMVVQYSRGCPFNCEFCDIIIMNGRIPRTKDKNQLLREFDVLYEKGWRGGIFIVDDNFIGNRLKVKEVLPGVIAWMKEKNYPFTLSTEASINLADDEELMELMIEAEFKTVFIGIETPNEESLTECGKLQNKNRDLVASVRKIQNCGFQVMGGFIVGFDNDPPSIFEKQIEFIQKSGIVTAMVGLLNALPGTRLWKRLKENGRLLKNTSGNNIDCSINFIPKMNYETLISGYKKILKTIYSSKIYYERIMTCLKEIKPVRKSKVFHFYYLGALIQSIWFLGIKNRGRKYYWKIILESLFRYPRLFPEAVSLSIYGFHFQKIVENLFASDSKAGAESL